MTEQQSINIRPETLASFEMFAAKKKINPEDLLDRVLIHHMALDEIVAHKEPPGYWGDLPIRELKRYVWSLKGELDRARERISQIGKGRPTWTPKEMESHALAQMRYELKQKDEAMRRYKRKNKDLSMRLGLDSFGRMKDADAIFVSDLMNIPLRGMKKVSGRRAEYILARTAYTYLRCHLDQATLTECAREMDYENHTTVLNLKDNFHLLTDEVKEALMTYHRHKLERENEEAKRRGKAA